jgi:(p)ppGpp synthase/HD superfamily hydrolase
VTGTHLGARFHEALAFASLLHQEQRRKGPEPIPYVVHLLGVCAIVLENRGTEDEAIAALLHDAVEDQGGLETAERIRAAFGDDVARIVLACSDATSVPKPPWHERKKGYHARLRTADGSTMLVSAADKLDNLRSIQRAVARQGEGYWSVFNASKSDSLWNYRTLAEIYLTSDDARVLNVAHQVDALVEQFEHPA